MKEDNSRYFDWLKHKVDYLGRYHDHKEQMAWLATAFYLAGILYLAFASRSEHFCNAEQWCITAFFLGATLVFIFFIKWQFKMRWYASLYVDALNLAMIRILSGAKLKTREREFRSLMPPYEDEAEWPGFVADELDKLSGQREGQRRWPRFLGIIPWFTSRTPEPLKSESITYFAVFLAFLAAVALIWWT